MHNHDEIGKKTAAWDIVRYIAEGEGNASPFPQPFPAGFLASSIIFWNSSVDVFTWAVLMMPKNGTWDKLTPAEARHAPPSLFSEKSEISTALFSAKASLKNKANLERDFFIVVSCMIYRREGEDGDSGKKMEMQSGFWEHQWQTPIKFRYSIFKKDYWINTWLGNLPGVPFMHMHKC